MKTIREISDRYPISEVEIETGFAGPKSCVSKINDKVVVETLWRNAYAQLKADGIFIVITATDWGGPIVTVKEEEPFRVDNMLYAWSVCRLILDRFYDSSWTKKLLNDVSFKKKGVRKYNG